MWAFEKWYLGQFVEVEHDENFGGVLELEVDLLEEKGLAHCNMPAIGGRVVSRCAQLAIA